MMALEAQRAEVADLLRTHAERVSASVGAPLVGWTVLPAPCEEHGDRWNLSGHAQLPLAAPEHASALARLHDAWTRLGYAVSAGGMSALSLEDRVAVSVQSTRPATALALLLLSPCYPSS